MPESERSLSEECNYLRGCINDLVGILGLRTIWSGADQLRVGGMLGDVLARMLQPDFVFVRLFCCPNFGSDIEIFRQTDAKRRDTGFEADVRVAADGWYEREARLGSHSITASVAGREYSTVAIDLGVRGEFGFIFAGSDRPQFPTPAERLLLNAAANQALIALQQHRILQEQKDVAARLDDLVAERSLALEEATEALRRSEALMAQAESASLTGSFRWHPDSDLLEWSAQALELFGFELGRRPTSDDFYDRVAVEDHPTLRIAEAHAQQAPIDLDLTFTVLVPGREPRVVHLLAQPSEGARERGCYIGTMQDITERVRAEAASQRSEVRLRELRDELSHATRLATLGQFSAAISHDVRQPLSSVSASAKAAMNWLNAPEPDLESARTATERIVKGVKRAAEILDRVKSFSRQNTEQTVVDLNDLVRDTIALVEADAAHRQVELKAALASHLPSLRLDRVQVQQVVMNLVVNALDAFEGEAVGARDVTIASWFRDGEIGVEVRDTGPGLSDAALPKLFQAFNTTKATGLGMGLSICRDIVTDHGGRIWASSNAPRGAIFSFALPAGDVPPARSG